jgi:cytidine deaminase
LIDIDWDGLKAAARAAAANAYAPYSGFHVGAAGLTADGRIVTGCNVENASYGLTFCAEVSMIGDLRRIGAPALVAVATMIDDGRPATPCGRCRQILFEHGGPDLLVDGDGTARTMAELLPGAFIPDDMEGRTWR